MQLLQKNLNQRKKKRALAVNSHKNVGQQHSYEKKGYRGGGGWREDLRRADKARITRKFHVKSELESNY